MTITQSWRRTWREILTDKGAVLLLFIATVVYSFFYPLPYQYERVEAVPIGIADLDRSAASRQLVRLLQAAPALEVVAVYGDGPALERAVREGALLGAVVVPAGFASELSAGRQAPLQAAGHGGYLLAGAAVLNTVTEAVANLGGAVAIQRLQHAGVAAERALAQQLPVELQRQPLYNPHEGYGSYVVPAVLVMIVQQTLLMGVTLLLGSRAEAGRGAGGVRGYLGMLLVFTAIGWLNTLYLFGFAVWYHGYPNAGGAVGLMLFAAVFAFACAAAALLLGRLCRRREQGLMLLLATAIPLFFLSGYPWPAEALPAPLQALRWLVPSTAGIQGLVALQQMGAEPAAVARELVALASLAVAAVAAGLYLYRGDAAAAEPGVESCCR